jgi:hypothetical protein
LRSSDHATQQVKETDVLPTFYAGATQRMLLLLSPAVVCMYTIIAKQAMKLPSFQYIFRFRGGCVLPGQARMASPAFVRHVSEIWRPFVEVASDLYRQ